MARVRGRGEPAHRGAAREPADPGAQPARPAAHASRSTWPSAAGDGAPTPRRATAARARACGSTPRSSRPPVEGDAALLERLVGEPGRERRALQPPGRLRASVRTRAGIGTAELRVENSGPRVDAGGRRAAGRAVRAPRARGRRPRRRPRAVDRARGGRGARRHAGDRAARRGRAARCAAAALPRAAARRRCARSRTDSRPSLELLLDLDRAAGALAARGELAVELRQARARRSPNRPRPASDDREEGDSPHPQASLAGGSGQPAEPAQRQRAAEQQQERGRAAGERGGHLALLLARGDLRAEPLVDGRQLVARVGGEGARRR